LSRRELSQLRIGGRHLNLKKVLARKLPEVSKLQILLLE